MTNEQCCSEPKVYYANAIMHFRCANCGEMWHRKPQWLDETDYTLSYYYLILPDEET